MRAKPFVTTAFVVSLVGAAVAVTHMASQQKGNATQPREYVLAATVALPAGTLLRAQDVTWQGVTEVTPHEIVRPSATVLAAKART
jgi:Flp pilus assembly protein CpaB